jgi:hypothetical protein
MGTNVTGPPEVETDISEDAKGDPTKKILNQPIPGQGPRPPGVEPLLPPRETPPRPERKPQGV